MKDRVDELMELSVLDLQKRAVAALVAVIESDEMYDDGKKGAIEVLADAQKELNEAVEYYNDIYEEIYEDVIEDVADALGFCDCEDDCDDCDCCDDDCEGESCCCYSDLLEENNKPDFCKCKKTCVECVDEDKPCIGLDCPNCENPRQDDEE